MIGNCNCVGKNPRIEIASQLIHLSAVEPPYDRAVFDRNFSINQHDARHGDGYVARCSGPVLWQQGPEACPVTAAVPVNRAKHGQISGQVQWQRVTVFHHKGESAPVRGKGSTPGIRFLYRAGTGHTVMRYAQVDHPQAGLIEFEVILRIVEIADCVSAPVK